MKIYALIQNNIVYNIIETDDSGWPEGEDITNMDNRPSIGWTYTEDEDGAIAFSPPQPDAETPSLESDPPPARRIITNLAFDLRFTLDERVAIELASIDNPAADIQERAKAATLRVSQERAKKASFTDLDDPVTRAGVELMEEAGLLAQGRALIILDAPIAVGERP